jgi:hypothetical protein
MRFSKAVVLLLVVVSLIVSTVPALAWDGSGRWPDCIETVNDHPWQDDNEDPTVVQSVRPVIVVGYSSVSIAVVVPSWLRKMFYSEPTVSASRVRTTIIKNNRSTSTGSVGVVGRNDLI